MRFPTLVGFLCVAFPRVARDPATCSGARRGTPVHAAISLRPPPDDDNTSSRSNLPTTDDLPGMRYMAEVQGKRAKNLRRCLCLALSLTAVIGT